MRYLLDGKPSFILAADQGRYSCGYILWGLPSGLMLQTRDAKVFLEGCKPPAVQLPPLFVSNAKEWEWLWQRITAEEEDDANGKALRERGRTREL